MQQALRERLIEEGFEVFAVDNVDQGLDALRGEDIQLILLDLRLGEKSGLDLLDEMRDDEAIDNQSVEVVVLTAIADPAMVGDVMGRGPMDYLVKADNSLDDIVEHVRKKISRKYG